MLKHIFQHMKISHLGCVDLLQHSAVPEDEILGGLGVGDAGEGDVAVCDDVAGCEGLPRPRLHEVPHLVRRPVPDTHVVPGVEQVLHDTRPARCKLG